jgi:excisionase family DNA binding protein
MNIEKQYTVIETAKILKVSTRTIMTYLKTGRLRGTQNPKKWLISASAIKKFLADGQKAQK